MSRPPTWLVPNLGAEEGDGWRSHATLPAVATARRLWRCLFAAPTAWLGLAQDESEDWPDALGPRPDAAVFDWLEPNESGDAAFAWLATAEAAHTAAQAGLRLAAPSPSVVQRVHDKAFAQRAARETGLEPECLRGLVEILEPEEFAHPDRLLPRIQACVAAWPAWTGGRFTLKPRLGSSGRGRVAGDAGEAAIRGALPRLAACGGALLEPWLERSEDLSVLLHVPPDRTRPIRVLASLRQHVSASGLSLGHAGEVAAHGEIHSGSACDESARQAAVAVAQAAREAGFHGPCGVDGFVFLQPQQPRPQSPQPGVCTADTPRACLRAVTELNARFTTGTAAVGLVRRALPGLLSQPAPGPDGRRAFYIALARPRGFASWHAALQSAGPDARMLPLWRAEESNGPALLWARELAAFAPVLRGARSAAAASAGRR